MSTKDKVDKLFLKYIDTLQSTDGNYKKIKHELRGKKMDKSNDSVIETTLNPIGKWLRRLLLLFLVYHLASNIMAERFNDQIEKFTRSDMSTQLENFYRTHMRKWSVYFGLQHSTILQEMETDCIVKNPFRDRSKICCHCGFKIKKTKVQKLDKAKDNYEKIVSNPRSTPFVVVNMNKSEAKFGDLRKMYQDNQMDFNLYYSRVISLKGQSITTAKQLFQEESVPSQSILMWDVGHVEGIRHMRKFVKRPPFIAEDLEITLERTWILIGSDVPTTITPVWLSERRPGITQQFVVVTSGVVQITLRTNDNCKCVTYGKSQQTVTLIQGSILSYHGECYKVGVSPHKKLPDGHVVYIGNQSN